MDGPLTNSPDDNDKPKKIADADWLVGQPSKPKSRPAATQPKAQPLSGPANTKSSGTTDDIDHTYDVIGGTEDPETDVPVAPIPVPVAPRKPKPRLDDDTAEPTGPPATVDEVWSRWGEWGGSVIQVGVALLLLGFALYLTITSMQLFLSFLVFVLGFAVVLVLCYPIFITLERPVRITPEQAAKDFYAMLSHGMPNYRRMWMLLSSTGKESSLAGFSDYDGFRSYWKKTLASLQGGKSGNLNPLKFRVEDFRSEKSAGLTALTAKYTVKVYRGIPTPDHEVSVCDLH